MIHERLQHGLVSMEGYMLGEAKDWLKDCYPDHHDYIEDLTEIETYKAIERYYAGGLEQFMIDGE